MIPRHYIRNAWYAAGLSEEFAVDDLQGHTIAERPVLMWRSRDGAIGAFDNRCAHKRMPLSEGRVLENGTLECAYHGLCYDPKGACVAVPLASGRTDSGAGEAPALPGDRAGRRRMGLAGRPGAPARVAAAAHPRGWGRRIRHGQLRSDAGARQLPAADREPARHLALLSTARRQHRRRRQQPDSGEAGGGRGRREPLREDRPRGRELRRSRRSWPTGSATTWWTATTPTAWSRRGSRGCRCGWRPRGSSAPRPNAATC